ncbi:MGMT family protein [Streptomyces sp. NPDC005963]|uniref:MGMT family protein n=1 Tax=Streptomyces sp. NPDC005963 TaxID=3156721 RepID=UPI0033E52ADB
MGGVKEQPHTADHPEGAGYPEYPEYAERVLDVVDLIPPGRVMTYGDVAEWLEEGGPRQVGRAMALYGSAVPWWRVVRADGTLLPGHEQEAMAAYRTEGTPLRQAPPGAEGHVPRIDMKRARWDGGIGDGTGGQEPPPGGAGHGAPHTSPYEESAPPASSEPPSRTATRRWTPARSTDRDETASGGRHGNG